MIQYKKKIFIPILMVFLIISPLVKADVIKTELDNGLILIVEENHIVPLASICVYVHTGSVYEDEYVGSGISHFLEHMMFSEADGLTKEYVDKKFEEIGAVGNAWTWKDATSYYHTVPSNNIDELIKLYVKLLFTAKFTDEEFNSQRGVILEEMKMVYDSPTRILQEEFYRLAYIRHPLRYPVIGTEDRFLSLKRDDIERYYNRYYSPNNMVISIVGDFKSEHIIELVKEEFGSYKMRDVRYPFLNDEPPIISEREKVIERDYELSYFRLGFRSTKLFDPNTPALDLLSAILSSGKDALLPRILKYKLGLVNDIETWNYTPSFIDGDFTIVCSMPYENIDKVKEEIFKIIGKIARDGVSKKDLERAKAQVKANRYLGAEDIEMRADLLCSNEFYYGDPNWTDRYIKIIENLSSDDIKRVARDYIDKGNLIEISIVPPGKGGVVSSAKEIEHRSPVLKTLSNGMKVLILERHNNPTVTLSVYALAGSVCDAPNKEGLSSLAVQMMLTGAGGMSSSEIARGIENLGGTLDYEAGNDLTSLRLNIVRDGFYDAIKILTEVIKNPSFNEAGLQRQKNLAEQNLKGMLDNWGSLSYIKARAFLYGSHPYSHIPDGTEIGIKGITIDDIRTFYNEYFKPTNMMITVVGDVDTDEVLARLEKLLGSWRKGDVFSGVNIPKADGFYNTNQTVEETWAMNQSVLYYMFPGIERGSNDEYALIVLDSILSGYIMPSGRLHERLRSEGLVYIVHLYLSPLKYGGFTAIYLATDERSLDRARMIVEEELERIKVEKVSEDELARAKVKALSAIENFRRQDFSDIAAQLTVEELLSGGFNRYFEFTDRIRDITSDDIIKIANKYLNNYLVFIVRPEIKEEKTEGK
ncbi:MAG: M16 family metallopeptidase [bacterium]